MTYVLRSKIEGHAQSLYELYKISVIYTWGALAVEMSLYDDESHLVVLIYITLGLGGTNASFLPATIKEPITFKLQTLYNYRHSWL